MNSNLEDTRPLKKAKQDRKAKPLGNKTLSKPRKVAVATSQHPKIVKRLSASLGDVLPSWEEPELLADKSVIDESVARNLIKLWEDGNTIPFIARYVYANYCLRIPKCSFTIIEIYIWLHFRYRKNIIGDMTAENLRAIKEDYVEICELKKKICTVAKAVAQSGKLDEKIQQNILASKTIEELEHIVGYLGFVMSSVFILLYISVLVCSI